MEDLLTTIKVQASIIADQQMQLVEARNLLQLAAREKSDLLAQLANLRKAPGSLGPEETPTG